MGIAFQIVRVVSPITAQYTQLLGALVHEIFEFIERSLVNRVTDTLTLS